MISAKHLIVCGMLVFCINFKQLKSEEKFLTGLNIISPTESSALFFLVLFLIEFLLEPEILKDLYLILYFS